MNNTEYEKLHHESQKKEKEFQKINAENKIRFNHKESNKDKKKRESYEELCTKFINYLLDETNKVEIDISSTINELNTSVGLSCLYEKLCNLKRNNDNGFNTLETWCVINAGPQIYKINNIKNYNFEFFYKFKLLVNIVISSNQHIHNVELLSNINIDLFSMKQNISNLNTELQSTNTKINNQDKDIVNKIKSNIYTDFIAILGIFTAITFAIFGGINTINSISSNLHISSSNPQNLGNLLLAAAVLGIVLFGVIMVLFAGIAKIAEKDYKLPLLLNISIISTLTVMFLVGCIFTFTANGGWHWNQNTIPLPRVVFSIIVVVTVYFIAFHFYRKYKLKHLSDKKSNTGNQTDI